MTNAQQPGVLAIWNDCTPEGAAEYEAWYRGEHLRERVGLLGFRFGRRYLSVDGSSPRYFTWYETDSADVLFSPIYLERGANPTPMTRHIMSTVFRNMNRTVCRRVRSLNEILGAFAVTVRADQTNATTLDAAWSRITALPDLLRTEFWQSAEKPDDAPSAEERIRGKDAKIAACVVATFSDPEHAEAAAQGARAILGPAVTIGTYRLSNALEHRDIAK